MSTVELGGGSKDANLEMCETIIYLFTHKLDDENIFSSTLDCASLNLNGACVLGLPMLLCDHRVFDVARSAFHLMMHGKGPNDDDFGIVELKWLKCVTPGSNPDPDTLLTPALLTPSALTASRWHLTACSPLTDDCRRVNPTGATSSRSTP